uniref:Uncharacterized protein n=1 Tax=Pyrodinium bahamense TaxID=73915 RepID=A0A7R9ZX16_9DINO|mmetsp:Transcript_13274/g.36563  ORF Transcript_13274/g.36563 Transcript_13274/m.36563 type:complete len:227 (+) Transcript_13274:103-783(+)
MAPFILSSTGLGLPVAFDGTESAQITALQDTLKDLDNFHRGFEVFRQSAKGPTGVPESLSLAWEKVYRHKDRLGKVKDYLWDCTRREEALTGPRPENLGDPDARQKMEGSVSALINNVVRESNELVSTCDKAQRLIGDPSNSGVSDEVMQLSKYLERAREKISNMVVGETMEATTPALLNIAALSLPLVRTAGLVSGNSSRAPWAGSHRSSHRRVRHHSGTLVRFL